MAAASPAADGTRAGASAAIRTDDTATVSATISRKGASRSPPYRSPATVRACSGSPASSIRSTAAPIRCSAACRERDRSVVSVSSAIAECTAYRSAVPSAAAVPTASADRGRRPVPRECSSTRSSLSEVPGPPTTEEAGAGRSRSRSTSAVRRAARRPAHSGAVATTAPEAS